MVSFSVPHEDRAARRVGTILAGKYGIERVLGVGGMATVFAAVHRNGRRVAVKLLHEELNAHQDVRARFVREGYVANAVGHAGAVLVYDDDVDQEDNAFLVMELLEGETLHDRALRRGRRLPCREVLALAHQLLDVLAAAHARGIVHRDIKPENLFLTTQGALKVLDFGVARMRDDAGGANATMTGARIGTPAFMAPEQALGRTAEIDARTDLWAVGATMFSLLAGRTVHVAENASELIVITATTQPKPLAEIAPDVPAPVAAVVDGALQLPRGARWESARAMQRALEEAHGEAFGEPLSPADVGPLPTASLPPLPRGQDEQETLPADGERSTTPAPRSRDPAYTSAPTLPSDRPPKEAPRTASTSSSSRSASFRESATVQLPASRRASDAGRTPSGASPPGPPSQPPAEPPSSLAQARPRRPWLFAAAAIAAIATLAVFGPKWLSGRPGRGGAAVSSGAATAGAPGGCTSNADCKGAGPSICRKPDGACVALETAQCKVRASPGDVANDATIWIGAMYPMRSLPDEGVPAANGVELARRDFAQTTGGLLPVRPGGPKRPIAVVLCDDSEAPERAAEHLVRDLGVPAILGFARSKEVMDLTTSLFLHNDVLALAANTSSALRDLPRSPSGARLVWRVTTSTDMNVPFLAAIVSDIIEPEVRAQPGALKPGEPMRVALTRVANPTGQSYADGFIKQLRFNGKSVAENGSSFVQIEMPDNLGSPVEEGPAVERLKAFLPHVIIPNGGGEHFIPAMERGWPPAAAFKPVYLDASSYLGPAAEQWLLAHPDLRRRLYNVDAAGQAEPTAKFVLHYNEVFSPHVTAATATPAPYDAFYLFAYAAAALGDRPITGSALGGAISRLLPGGERVDVGPGDIYRALYALGAGKSIDLNGAMTTLDFDLATGDATVDFALYCFTAGSAKERPLPVPSGVFFRAATQKLEGARRCP